MKYNYTKFYEIFCENMNFFKCIFEQTDQPNQSKPNRLVWFGFFIEKQ